MAAVVEEQGHSKAEADTVSINQDDDFDFDIGGPEAYLDTEAGAESTNEGLTYQVDASGAPDGSYTYRESDDGAQKPLEESYSQENHEQGYGQDVFDTSEFDATTVTQEYGEDRQDGHFEEEEEDNVHQAETGQFEEIEVQEDEISYDETAGEFDGFDDTAQPDVGQAHGAMDTATSVEYAHHEEENHEEEHHEEERHEEERHEEERHEEERHEEERHEEEHHEEEQFEVPADAEDEFGAQVEGGSELLPEGNLSHEMGENETRIVTDLNGKGSVGDAGAHTEAEDELPVTRQKTDSVDEIMAAAAWQEDGYEDQQHDEQPHIRVFWRTEEFRLFAESPVDDPDTYFFKGLDSLQQPLSQFLAGLRQVVDNELAISEEVFVKVDGLGLEFGETTTTDFLERTTFGQILDLHNRLMELDDGSTSHELYLYLDARPSCLHRFNELTNGAEEGKGLSQFALYYEDASTDMPANDDEQDQLEDLEDMYSDGVSNSDSHNEQQEEVDETRQAEPYNPFRVTETQLHAVEAAPFSDPAKKDGEKDASSTNAMGAHNVDDEIGNADLISGEDQDGLDLESADILDDAAVDENLQGTTSGPDEAHDVATEDLGERYEAGGDGEEDITTVEVETSTGVLEENPRETHNPTDGEKTFLYNECSAPRICYCDECMSSEPPSPCLQSTVPTDLRVQAPANQLAGDDVGAITSSISGFLKAQDPETFITDSSSFSFNQAKANLILQDHDDAAENDDYLDLGNDVDTTDDKLLKNVGRTGTPDPMTHDSSTTATLDGDDHGNGDGAPVAHNPTDASHAADLSKQPDVDPSDNELDEIDWKEGEDDEDDDADQNPTDLSPSSISAKRSRQEDKDDDGLGGESPVKRRRT